MEEEGQGTTHKEKINNQSPKATIDHSSNSSSDDTNIHGDYYTYGMQPEQSSHTCNCFLHLHNTPNAILIQIEPK